MESKENKTFKFDGFEVDADRRLLLKQGIAVTLNSKTFDLLWVLLENHGKILTKNELLETVWAEQFVEENNLTVHISALRKILGESKNQHQFIVTVPGKGYKFIGELEKEEETEIIIERHQFEKIIIEEEINSDQPNQFENVSPKLLISHSKRFSSNWVLVFSSLVILLLAIATGWWVMLDQKKIELKPFTFTNLTNSGKITNVTITLDGKYAVFSQVEKNGESLWLRHIATGSQNQILKSQAVNFVGLAVTPDSNFIYATIFSNDLPDPQVWRIPFLGGSTEQIKGIVTGAAVTFSPDGKRMAFTQSHTSIHQTSLAHTDLNGEDKQFILSIKDNERSLPNFKANPVVWSPDGQQIACAIEENITDGKKKSAVLLISIADKSERFLTGMRWDYVENVAWINAENLAVIGDGKLWLISQKTGGTNQISENFNNYSWIAGANGNLLTVKKHVVSKVSVVDFNEKVEKLEKHQIFEESGYISSVNWTLDGKIVYHSTASGQPEIWRINEDSSDKNQLTVNSNISLGLSVSPTDGSLLFASLENGKHTLYLTDSEGKNLHQVLEGTEDVWGNFTIDGKSVIFQRGLNNKTITLWRFDLADKKLSQLTQKHALHPVISPDGTQIAHYFMDNENDNLWRIKLISSITGEFLGKIDLPKDANKRKMRWHPSGKFIAQIANQGEETKLLLLPVNGIDPVKTFDLGKGDLQWFEWSKDGGKIVVSQSTETQDIVLLRQ